MIEPDPAISLSKFSLGLQECDCIPQWWPSSLLIGDSQHFTGTNSRLQVASQHACISNVVWSREQWNILTYNTPISHWNLGNDGAVGCAGIENCRFGRFNVHVIRSGHMSSRSGQVFLSGEGLIGIVGANGHCECLVEMRSHHLGESPGSSRFCAETIDREILQS